LAAGPTLVSIGGPPLPQYERLVSVHVVCARPGSDLSSQDQTRLAVEAVVDSSQHAGERRFIGESVEPSLLGLALWSPGNSLAADPRYIELRRRLRLPP
jgi:hypothetical protein